MDMMLETRQDLISRREYELEHRVMELHSKLLHQQFELFELRLTLRFGWMMVIGCFAVIVAARL